MTNEQQQDSAVLQMIKSRSSTAVLKAVFLLVKGPLLRTPIFVYEGREDKVVYAQWIRRLDNNLSYEPFLCGGKGSLLRLFDALLRDRNEAIRLVYFFVDKDFDALRGRTPHARIFLTDYYSVENYIVHPIVLEDVLKIELECHGRAAVRNSICDRFCRCYDEFLDVTKPLNFIIFQARSFQIPIVRGIDLKLVEMAAVTLTTVSQPEDGVANIDLEVVPPAENIESIKKEFETLNRRNNYRGKFALLFFQKWLRLLVEEYKTRKQGLFEELKGNAKPMEAEITLGSLASRSPIPVGLDQFLARVRLESAI